MIEKVLTGVLCLAAYLLAMVALGKYLGSLKR
jgi:hypothetical protein